MRVDVSRNRRHKLECWKVPWKGLYASGVRNSLCPPADTLAQIRVRRIRKIGHDVKLVVQPRSSITRFGGVVLFLLLSPKKKRKEGKKKKNKERKKRGWWSLIVVVVWYITIVVEENQCEFIVLSIANSSSSIGVQFVRCDCNCAIVFIIFRVCLSDFAT